MKTARSKNSMKVQISKEMMNTMRTRRQEALHPSKELKQAQIYPKRPKESHSK